MYLFIMFLISLLVLGLLVIFYTHKRFFTHLGFVLGKKNIIKQFIGTFRSPSPFLVYLIILKVHLVLMIIPLKVIASIFGMGYLFAPVIYLISGGLLVFTIRIYNGKESPKLNEWLSILTNLLLVYSLIIIGLGVISFLFVFFVFFAFFFDTQITIISSYNIEKISNVFMSFFTTMSDVRGKSGFTPPGYSGPNDPRLGLRAWGLYDRIDYSTGLYPFDTSSPENLARSIERNIELFLLRNSNRFGGPGSIVTFGHIGITQGSHPANKLLDIFNTNTKLRTWNPKIYSALLGKEGRIDDFPVWSPLGKDVANAGPLITQIKAAKQTKVFL